MAKGCVIQAQFNLWLMVLVLATNPYLATDDGIKYFVYNAKEEGACDSILPGT